MHGWGGLLGRARLISSAETKVFAQLQVSNYRARIERGMIVTVEGFDWNCPQHITPRFTEAQVLTMVGPLKDRIVELETTLANLRT